MLVQMEQSTADGVCALECGPDKTCKVDTCCAPGKNSVTVSQSDADNMGLRQRKNHKYDLSDFLCVP